MSEETTNITDLDRVAITLSTIAYLGVDASHGERFKMMAKALQNKALPTKQQWGLVWGPHEKDQFLMYIAQGPRTQFGRNYALVIRGTVESAWNIFVDLDTPGVSSIPWPAPEMPGGKLAWGVVDTWKKLKDLHQGPNKQTVVDFLRGVDAGSAVMVTGHSLGGQMASALASWLRAELNIPKKQVGVTPITFAGPTAGNKEFASPYEKVFPTGKRYYNDFDIVPKLWNHDDLASIRDLYPGSGAPKCDFENGCREAVDLAQAWAGRVYEQTGGGAKLTSKLYGESGKWFPFEDEVLAQHSSLLYMWLMGIPTSAIQSLFPQENWKPPQ